MQDVFKKDAPRETRALYHKHAMGNSLFRNASRNGGGAFAFEDTTRAAVVGIGRWAWSSDSWDFDLVGFPDLYICNGMVIIPTLINNNEVLNSIFRRQRAAISPLDAQPTPS